MPIFPNIVDVDHIVNIVAAEIDSSKNNKDYVGFVPLIERQIRTVSNHELIRNVFLIICVFFAKN